MVVQHKDIAIKFIYLYWQQTAPYGAGLPNTTTSVLIQNNGVQAAVVTPITARRSAGFADLVSKVAQTVSDQPMI